jgi:hypothetical protein
MLLNAEKIPTGQMVFEWTVGMSPRTEFVKIIFQKDSALHLN